MELSPSQCHCAENQQEAPPTEVVQVHFWQGPLDSLCPVQPACLFTITLSCLLLHRLSFNLHQLSCLLSVPVSFSFSSVTKEIHAHR